MTSPFWQRWLDSSRPNKGNRRPQRRLRLEALEDRLAPAFNLTVGTGATAGVATTVSGTTTTFTANATGAFLSVADVVTALATGNVVVDSGSTGTENGDITISAGITSPVAGSTLTFQGGSGTGAVGNINIDAAIAPAGAGQAFPLNFLALNNLVIDGTLNSGGSIISLTATGAGGVATLDSGSGGVTSNGGNITINAD